MHGTPSIISQYQLLLQGFEKWLSTLEYAESTVYASTNYMRDFFTYLTEREILNPERINKQVIKTYYNYLQERKNKRQPGSLSQNYIVSNINALRRFGRYLQATGKQTLEIDLHLPIEKENPRNILTTKEVELLYKACDNDILGIRDRAMLSIYYGCGLRRNEGQSLDVSDILLKEKLVYVRKGKGYKERYVPMTEAIKEDLENYIYVSRQHLQSFKPDRKEPALFISMRAKRMHGNSIILRLQKLIEKANLPKETGLHTLRHSIATHLLQSGMSLESVSRFLGHQSLESTQIYTHLANE
jgi:integrase/recombinase XerD